jgi:hypothetical protein
MDYLTNADSVPMNTPGDYDGAAVKYLYGLTSAAPAQTFCTDNGVGADPNCEVFDRSDDPLNKHHGKYYDLYLDYFYKTQNVFVLLYWDYWLNNVLNYVRVGSAPALARTTKTFNAPVSPDVLKANPNIGPLIDLISQWTYARMFLDPASWRGSITKDPPSSLWATIIPQLKGNLQNVDAIRSYPTRRMMVDILKNMQDMRAYDALLTARASIAAVRATLTGAEAELTDDLLARIDQATRPYFKN